MSEPSCRGRRTDPSSLCLGVKPCSVTMHVTRRDSRSCTRSGSAKYLRQHACRRPSRRRAPGRGRSLERRVLRPARLLSRAPRRALPTARQGCRRQRRAVLLDLAAIAELCACASERSRAHGAATSSAAAIAHRVSGFDGALRSSSRDGRFVRALVAVVVDPGDDSPCRPACRP